MKTIRRLYLYGVALTSLETVLWGIVSLARSAISGTQVRGDTELLAGALSFILVGLPVFFLHWWLAQRGAAQEAEERFAGTRAIFLYATLLATLIPALQNTLALVDRAILSALGQETAAALVGADQTAVDNGIAIAVNLAVGAYFFYILKKDWDAAPEGDAYAQVRRVYRFIWVIYALGLAVFGAQQTIRALIDLARGLDRLEEVKLANGLALFLVGTPIWAVATRVVEGALGRPEERWSMLRLVVLYALTLVGVVGVLEPVWQLLFELIRWVLGAPQTLQGVVSDLGRPLSQLPPLGAVWFFYGRTLNQEVSAMPAMPRRASLRRLYRSIVSLGGLGAAFFGLQMVLSAGVDLAWGELLRDSGWRSQVAGALASLMVGLPLWLMAWRPLLQEANRTDERGDHARRSVVRKGYLYLTLFVGVVGTMFSIGGLLFEILNALLGEPVDEDLLRQAVQLLKTILLFGLLGVYHWVALRKDARLAEQALAKLHAQFPVLVLDPGDEVFANQVVPALQHELPAIPVAVHRAEQGVPTEELEAARAVILPSSLASNPPEAMRLWLKDYRGVHLVIPIADERWLWVEATQVSMEKRLRRLMHLIRQLAEEEK